MAGTSVAPRVRDAVQVAPPAQNIDVSPTDFASMMRLAEVLVTTGFLPETIKTAAQACAIILTGRELGVAPMQALRLINVIKGKPSISSELQLSIFHRKGGRSRVVASTDVSCEMYFRHPNGEEITEVYTIDDAKRARLIEKENWRFYPKQMLRARCISGALRVLAPDLIGASGPEDDRDDDATEIPERPLVAPEAARATAVEHLAATTADPYAGDPHRESRMPPAVPASGDATEDQITALLELVARPGTPSATKERVELRLTEGISKKTAEMWIELLRSKGMPDPDGKASDTDPDNPTLPGLEAPQRSAISR